MELCRYLSGTIRMLSAQVDSMTFQQADQRLAELLLQLSQEAEGSSLSTPLPRVVRATHEELAFSGGRQPGHGQPGFDQICRKGMDLHRLWRHFSPEIGLPGIFFPPPESVASLLVSSFFCSSRKNCRSMGIQIKAVRKSAAA